MLSGYAGCKPLCTCVCVCVFVCVCGMSVFVWEMSRRFTPHPPSPATLPPPLSMPMVYRCAPGSQCLCLFVFGGYLCGMDVWMLPTPFRPLPAPFVQRGWGLKVCKAIPWDVCVPVCVALRACVRLWYLCVRGVCVLLCALSVCLCCLWCCVCLCPWLLCEFVCFYACILLSCARAFLVFLLIWNESPHPLPCPI